jgi:hypothetical protein
MGYATTVMRLRDVDRETEITIEALEGESDDGAVLELTVVQPYGAVTAEQTRGWVRLTRRHFDALAEWIGNHANNLRNIAWAEENAPDGEGSDDE